MVAVGGPTNRRGELCRTTQDGGDPDGAGPPGVTGGDQHDCGTESAERQGLRTERADENGCRFRGAQTLECVRVDRLTSEVSLDDPRRSAGHDCVVLGECPRGRKRADERFGCRRYLEAPNRVLSVVVRARLDGVRRVRRLDLTATRIDVARAASPVIPTYTPCRNPFAIRLIIVPHTMVPFPVPWRTIVARADRGNPIGGIRNAGDVRNVPKGGVSGALGRPRVVSRRHACRSAARAP